MQRNLEKIKKAFPSYLSTEIDILSAAGKLNLAQEESAESFQVLVGHETVSIPYRVYSISTYDCEIYNQDYIVDCYLTRHHNGFIREKHLRKIIRLNKEWVVPYVISLLGEYVVEILDVIYHELDNLDPELYRAFIENNLEFYNLMQGRVASYYGYFYRGYYPYNAQRRKHNISRYPGFKILKFIKNTFLK